MAVNQKLRIARKRMHWSLADAAKACGEVSLNTFHRWEQGIQTPHGHNLELMCRAFNASMEDLGYSPEEQEAAPQEETHSPLITLSSEQVALLQPLLFGGETMDESKRRTLQFLFAAVGGASVPTELGNAWTQFTKRKEGMEPPLAEGLEEFEEPWKRLAAEVPVPVNEESVHSFEKLLTLSRNLGNSNELIVARKTLDSFLPRLQEAALHQSSHQMEIAGLTSQAFLLKSIFVAHDLQILEKRKLCQAAVVQAKKSQNPNIVVAALLQLGVAYHYAGQGSLALQTQLEALSYVNQVSPLVASHIYTELASSLAQNGRVHEARFYMDFAYQTFPSHPDQDASSAFDDHWWGNLALYKGIMYIHLSEPNAAWEAFDEYKGSIIPERMRLEIVNYQAKVALLEEDREKYADRFRDAMAGAIALRSKRRLQEALTTFRHDVPRAWYKDQPLKSIIEQYKLLKG